MTPLGKLDHVAFGAADIADARQRLSQLGFSSVDGSCDWTLSSRSFSAGSASVMFADTYLDVIEISDPGWREYLTAHTLAREGIGPSGLVLGVPELDRARDRLEAAGSSCLEAYDIERRTDKGTNRYRIFPIDLRGTGSLPVSVLKDFSPQALRSGPSLRHANGCIGLEEVVCHAVDPAAAADWSRELFEVSDAGATQLQASMETSSARVRYASGGDSFFQSLIEALPDPQARTLLCLRMRSSDLAQTRACFDERGVPWAATESGGVVIAPGDAIGCALEFV